jgi:hypothetical protein
MNVKRELQAVICARCGRQFIAGFHFYDPPSVDGPTTDVNIALPAQALAFDPVFGLDMGDSDFAKPSQ